ncbi:MAG: carbamoyl phosphate synthase small subunit [bacterium]
MKAYLIFEDGHVFKGESIGARREVISEFVFNTSMTGYTEILSDPSYVGQSVVMTYPLIGNYGVSLNDQESAHPYLEGFVVHELSQIGSNYRMNMNLNDYLMINNIPGIQGVDTRAVTKLLRQNGCLKGMITTFSYDLKEALQKIDQYKLKNAVKSCTCEQAYTLGKGTYRVALYDFGVKKTIINELLKRDCQVTVVPAFTKAREILNGSFDGIVLSNGPGDPGENKSIIRELKQLAKSRKPIFGICLGHQMMALAHGFETEKLVYGHHGSNHPVRDLMTGRVYITTQNHNYVIVRKSIDEQKAQVWFENINDGTIEGLHYLDQKIKTVQFHPEASAGPLDTGFLFDTFITMMKEEADA